MDFLMEVGQLFGKYIFKCIFALHPQALTQSNVNGQPLFHGSTHLDMMTRLCTASLLMNASKPVKMKKTSIVAHLTIICMIHHTATCPEMILMMACTCMMMIIVTTMSASVKVSWKQWLDSQCEIDTLRCDVSLDRLRDCGPGAEATWYGPIYGKYLSQSAMRTIYGMLLRECKQACLQESEFHCRSIGYLKASKTCYLKSLTRYDSHFRTGFP